MKMQNINKLCAIVLATAGLGIAYSSAWADGATESHKAKVQVYNISGTTVWVKKSNSCGEVSNSCGSTIADNEYECASGTEVEARKEQANNDDNVSCTMWIYGSKDDLDADNFYYKANAANDGDNCTYANPGTSSTLSFTYTCNVSDDASKMEVTVTAK